MALVLVPIGALGFIEDLRHERLIGPVLIPRRVCLDRRPIDRDHADRRQPRLRAQRQHAHEHLAQRELVPAAELRDRRVIRHRHRRDHFERNIDPGTPARSRAMTG